MLFAIIARDRADGAPLRAAHRPEHLAWLEAAGEQVRLAGPLLDAAAQKPRGSLIIIEAPDLAAAHDFAQNDPFNKAGLFETVEIAPWRFTLGAWKAA